MKKSITLHYGSEFNEIDANTLIISLMSISEAVTDINRYLNSVHGTDNKINIRINAVTKGSIIFDITLVQSIGEAIIGVLSNSNNLNILVNAFTSITDIVIFLKSKKPKSVQKNDSGSVIIENQFNNCREITINNYNFYMNCPAARKAIAKNNEALSDDPSVNEFEVLQDNNPLISVSHKEMEGATEAPPLVDNEQERNIFEDCIVKATKLSYNRLNKWTFVKNGNIISARIVDDKFWAKVDRNEPFSKGDEFEVKLQITQEWNEEFKVWINKIYTVVEVINHESPEPEIYGI